MSIAGYTSFAAGPWGRAARKGPVMASRGFLPNRDTELLAWSLNFKTLITATPTAYGLTSALATAYGTLHDAYASALAAVEPAIRTRGAVVTKNAARTALKTQARLLANLVDGTASVTNTQKTTLGLNVRRKRTPVPPPATSPVLSVLSVKGWTVAVRLKASNVAKRGRPVGAVGATLFSYVGTTPPSTASGWKFEGNTGKSVFEVEFDSALAPGAKVWLSAFWFNGSKESGPACTPVSTNLQGGALQLNATAEDDGRPLSIAA